MCNQEGPKGVKCFLEDDHTTDHAGWTSTSLRIWSNDWRRNDNRTTWRST